MSIYVSRCTHVVALILSCILLPGISTGQVSFTANRFHNTKSLTMGAHGDFNNDGREDFIVHAVDFNVHPATIQYELYLSNGGGSYNSPIPLPESTGSIVVGDFNHDGKLDFAAAGKQTSTGFSSEMRIYLGNGDGTFQAAKVMTGDNSRVDGFAAADLNHDGKTDLIQLLGPSSGVEVLQLWISNGDGTFTPGQRISSVQFDGSLVAGDFDGDGKADVAITLGQQNDTEVQVWYGDGAGHLGSPFHITAPNTVIFAQNDAVDINNDGRSDLIGAYFIYGSSGTSQNLKELGAFIGNSNRTLSFKTIPTGNCTFGSVSVADYNGDGLNDLEFGEADCTGTGSEHLVVKPGIGSGNFGPEETIYTFDFTGGRDSVAARATRNTKPDIAFTEALGAETSPSTVPPSALTVLLNATTGAFPRCAAPNSATGISVCSPGTSAVSPVRFSIGAAGPTDMRKAEVWVDGHKVAQQLKRAFSHYSFLDSSVALASGTHSIVLFGAGWDNWLEQKSFTLTVTCPAPSTPSVHACSPLNGSTVTSPVHAQAAATVTGTIARMELWVDGVKKFTTFSNSLNTQVSLGTGTHSFAFVAVNTAGQKWSSSVSATVK